MNTLRVARLILLWSLLMMGGSDNTCLTVTKE
jgi:hypothetical protein